MSIIFQQQSLLFLCICIYKVNASDRGLLERVLSITSNVVTYYWNNEMEWNIFKVSFVHKYHCIILNALNEQLLYVMNVFSSYIVFSNHGLLFRQLIVAFVCVFCWCICERIWKFGIAFGGCCWRFSKWKILRRFKLSKNSGCSYWCQRYGQRQNAVGKSIIVPNDLIKFDW